MPMPRWRSTADEVVEDGRPAAFETVPDEVAGGAHCERGVRPSDPERQTLLRIDRAEKPIEQEVGRGR